MMKYASVVTPSLPVKSGVLFFCMLMLTACMGKTERSLPEKQEEDKQAATIVSQLPVCSSHRDVIICDWGKDQDDLSTKHPMLSELLPSGVKDKWFHD
ncbi:hypothetical protein [Klebsiella aerogenes]|uniref:hypothetical protein n=1 Tax=Klebsiella aerogenes TaxID=548 RepID=UPI001F15FD37|nr:hypothetical protein [Klebsiella aerogenes]